MATRTLLATSALAAVLPVAPLNTVSHLAVAPDTTCRDLIESPPELDFGLERGILEQDGYLTRASAR